MPSFTEAAMTFRARTLGLRPTPKHVLAHPAIYPFALLNKALSAWATLDGVRDIQLLFRFAAHWGAFQGMRPSGSATCELEAGTMNCERAATGPERVMAV